MSSGLKVASATSPDLSEKHVGETRNSVMIFTSSNSSKQTSPRKIPRQPSYPPQTRQYGKFMQSQKRRGSFSANDSRRPSFSKRKKKDNIVPPTKFLLGGNITDPLNLGSLEDEEVNRLLNQATPKSSPLPTPWHKMQVEVLIPPNINDPLNLNAGSDNDDLELNLISPRIRKSRKHKKRKKHGSGDAMESPDEEPEAGKGGSKDNVPTVNIDESPKLHWLKVGEDSPKFQKLKRVDDKIVSPVVKQPGAWETSRTQKPKLGYQKPERSRCQKKGVWGKNNKKKKAAKLS